jgi:hypothetical protein
VVKRIAIVVSVCHGESWRGMTPISATCAARQGAETIISTKWKRSAVLALKSRSAWCTRWSCQSRGTLYLSTCQM